MAERGDCKDPSHTRPWIDPASDDEGPWGGRAQDHSPSPPRATDEQLERVRKIAAKWEPLPDRALEWLPDDIQALLSELEHHRERERAAEELAEAVERWTRVELALAHYKVARKDG